MVYVLQFTNKIYTTWLCITKTLIIYTFNAESFQGMLQLIYHAQYLQITNPVYTRILQILITEEKTKLRT